MFWFWAVVSMLGYATQNVLMARYVRSMDVLSAGFYRNLTFVVSFLPLLYFVSTEKYQMMISFLPLIILAGFLGAASQWTRFLALRYFPIGVSSSGIMGFNVGLAWLLGWFYFGEALSLPVLFSLVLILAGSVTLSATKQCMPHLESTSVLRGGSLIFVTSLLITTAFVIVAKVSREVDPLLTAYVWEVLIAPAALIFIGFRKLARGNGLEKISLKVFHKIFWCVAPTAVGTAGFALAVTMGPVAIVSAISATGVLVATWMAVILYHEKLQKIHYIAMGITVLGVICLKLLSS